MESIRLSFEAVMPIFLLMLVGYIIKRLGMADKKSFDTINKLVFKVFLPVLLFYNIYGTKVSGVLDWKLMAFVVAGIISVFIAGYFIAMVVTKENARRGVLLQSFFRANFAILGVPLVKYICGEGSGGLTSFMVVVIVPAFNILAVVALKRFGSGEKKLGILSLLKGVATNPLIIGCVLGLIFFLLDIKLPSVVEKAVKDISSVATPLAIIALGAEFEFSDMRGYVKEIVVATLARLVIVPAIMLPIAVRLGFSGEALACLLVAFGAPIAISSFSMAQQMGGDEKLAAQIIVVTSAACLFTLFGWIFVLSYLNLF